MRTPEQKASPCPARTLDRMPVGTLLVRRARPEDAEAVSTVHVRSWQAAYRGLVPQWYLDELDPRQRRPVWERRIREADWPRSGLLVAVRDERVVGFLGMNPVRDHDLSPEMVGEVATIYVDPRHWGEGVGGRLMRAGLENLASAGYREARPVGAEGQRPDAALLRGGRLARGRHREAG